MLIKSRKRTDTVISVLPALNFQHEDLEILVVGAGRDWWHESKFLLHWIELSLTVIVTPLGLSWSKMGIVGASLGGGVERNKCDKSSAGNELSVLLAHQNGCQYFWMETIMYHPICSPNRVLSKNIAWLVLKTPLSISNFISLKFLTEIIFLINLHKNMLLN